MPTLGPQGLCIQKLQEASASVHVRGVIGTMYLSLVEAADFHVSEKIKRKENQVSNREREKETDANNTLKTM
jgi:hypothetical protein